MLAHKILCTGKRDFTAEARRARQKGEATANHKGHKGSRRLFESFFVCLCTLLSSVIQFYWLVFLRGLRVSMVKYAFSSAPVGLS